MKHLTRLTAALAVLVFGTGYAVYLAIVERNLFGAMLNISLACVAAIKIAGIDQHK